jgi:formylmethanofuran dehydrogenase subunit E
MMVEVEVRCPKCGEYQIAETESPESGRRLDIFFEGFDGWGKEIQ